MNEPTAFASIDSRILARSDQRLLAYQNAVRPDVMPPCKHQVSRLFPAGLVGLLLGAILLSSGCGEPSEIVERPTVRANQSNQLADQLGPPPASRTKTTPTPITVEQREGRETRRTKAIQAQLRQLQMAIATRVRGDEGAALDIFSDDFSARTIDRLRFAERYESDQFTVSRWGYTDMAPQLENSPSLITALAESLYKPWMGTPNFQLELKLFSAAKPASKESEANPGSLIVATALGDVTTRIRRQATSLWVARWNKDELQADTLNGSMSTEARPLKLEHIQVVAQEEIVARVSDGRLMRDCTASIMQNCKTMQNQLRFGIDQWSQRIPGIDMLGQHGIAVGDVNGDGLDDLYVCQPHGLPNALLVQNPDGTVQDRSAAAGVDVLDDSRSALLVDLDNDRDQDLVIATDESLLLFSNSSDGSFRLEHRLTLGRSTHSLSAVDYDQDGDLDLFLCKHEGVRHQDDAIVLPFDLLEADDGGQNVLLRNDEGWQFVDATYEAGITSRNSYFTRSASWSDYDLDGDQDLYIANEFAGDQLYRNDDGQLRDVTFKTGIGLPARHRTVSAGDFNQDGRPDFFVGSNASASAMRAFGSPDRSDGSLDPRIAVTGDSQIWHAGADGNKWRLFAMRAPLFSAESVFGSLIVDLNNDGWNDLAVTNGQLTRDLKENVDLGLNDHLFITAPDARKGLSIVLSPSARDAAKMVRETTERCRDGYSFAGSQRNRFFLSIGKLGFANAGPVTGLDFDHDGRAIAATDWDNDGDADLVITTRNGPQLKILCNQCSNDHGFLSLRLVGTQSNADAIGARVAVFAEERNKPWVRFVQAGSGCLAQSSKRLLFGLGKNTQVERVDVKWPNGLEQTFSDIVANGSYVLTEGQDKANKQPVSRESLQIDQRRTYAGDQPPAGSRALFNPPGLLPELRIANGQGESSSAVNTSTTAPTLLLFCDKASASQQTIQSVLRTAGAWDDNELDLAVVVIDHSADEDAADPSDTNRLEDSFADSLRWGKIDTVSRQRLRVWTGNTFNRNQLPKLPFGIMTNPRGRACIFYSSNGVDDADFWADKEIANGSIEDHWNAVMPRSGRWFSRYRFPSADRMAMRLSDLGDSSGAETLIHELKELRAYEFCQKGREVEAAGGSAAAAKFFLRAAEWAPELAVAHLRIGQLRRKQARSLSGAKNEAKKKLLLAEAIRALDTAIRLDPKDTESALARAYAAVDVGDFDKAIKLLEQNVQLQPNDYRQHAVIGRLLVQQQRFREANQWLMTAFEHHPTLPQVSSDLGFVHLAVGMQNKAVRFLNLAHQLQPSDKNIPRLQAEAYFLTGDHANSVERCELLVRSKANQQRQTYLLAWLLATSPSQSVRDAERALELMENPTRTFGDQSATTLEIYAAALAENNQFDQAIEIQKRAVALVNERASLESYSPKQREGMNARLKRYNGKRPYRTEEAELTPLGVPRIINEIDIAEGTSVTSPTRNESTVSTSAKSAGMRSELPSNSRLAEQVQLQGLFGINEAEQEAAADTAEPTEESGPLEGD